MYRPYRTAEVRRKRGDSERENHQTSATVGVPRTEIQRKKPTLERVQPATTIQYQCQGIRLLARRGNAIDGHA